MLRGVIKTHGSVPRGQESGHSHHEDKVSFFFVFYFLRVLQGSRLFFSHTLQNYYKTQMHDSITLNFGTDTEYIKMNTHTRFARNLIYLQCYECLFVSKKINFWLQGKPPMGITCVHRLAIVAVLDGLKNKKVTATKLQSKNQTTVNHGVKVLGLPHLISRLFCVHSIRTPLKMCALLEYYNKKVN